MATISSCKRRCTDALFLLAFIAFWVGMLAVGGYGFSKGDPALLIMGTDYEGVLCDEKGTGVNGKGSGNVIDNTGLKTRYWANFLEVAAVARAAAVAVTTQSFSSSSYTLADAKSMCVSMCPQPSTDGSVARGFAITQKALRMKRVSRKKRGCVKTVTCIPI